MSTVSAPPAYSFPQRPSLPAIPSSVEDRVLRHSGLNDNNEILSLLGATVLTTVVTMHLIDIMPGRSSGDVTIQRSRLVDKKIVEKFSVSYGLPERLQCMCNAATVQKSINARCSVFYAYVGAVWQESGLETVSAWLNPLVDLELAQ